MLGKGRNLSKVENVLQVRRVKDGWGWRVRWWPLCPGLRGKDRRGDLTSALCCYSDYEAGIWPSKQDVTTCKPFIFHRIVAVAMAYMLVRIISLQNSLHNPV